MPIPTTLVTGALGVGKTTAILGLLGHRPPGERWAVLVNEFGRVGIDGPILDQAAGAGTGGLEVREIAGGCICCTANVPLRVGLTQLVRELRPDRLLIEPTGLAHPASVVDAVRAPGLRESLALRATIGLFDPARYLATVDDPLYADQVRAADVVVGNFADRTAPEVLERFQAAAAAAYPPPLRIVLTSFGALDPALLDLEPAPRSTLRIVAPAEVTAHELGFVWPPERVFVLDGLQDVLQRLVRPGPLLPDGALRLKGVFRTPRGFLLVQATPDTIRFEPLGWRRDSRVSILASAAAPDPDAVEAAFEETCSVSPR
ncbi:MAG: CobW family GTP-binding protein [Myxococcota bacterium]